MASIYESNWFKESGLWGGMSPIPQIPEVSNLQPLNTAGMSPIPKAKPTVSLPQDYQELPTINLNEELLSPAVQNSISSYYKNLGKQTEQASKYYEKANMANKVAGYTNIAQGAFNLINAYSGRNTVRLTNKQLDMQKDLIDLNITNSESILSAQFKNAIADLQTIYAAKNVDISSQALRSEIVGSGEDMGKDMATTRTQGKLQKLAIDFQKSMNVAQQRRNEQQAWINFGANIASSAMYLI